MGCRALPGPLAGGEGDPAAGRGPVEPRPGPASAPEPQMKVYLGRAVTGELGPRSLEAIQLAHRALVELGAQILCERVADPDYRPGIDRPQLIAEMMRRELGEAEAGCFETSGRSTGGGFEAGWLVARKRPGLFLYDARAPPASAAVLYPILENLL